MSEPETPSTVVAPADEHSLEAPIDASPAVSTTIPAEADTTAEPFEGGTQEANFVYAIGRIEPRFPSLAVEKEFAQATGRAETAGLTDSAARRDVLYDRGNRYLVRQLVWVLTIEGLETYILSPRDPTDFESLVETLRAAPRSDDIDVVIGIQGPIAPPESTGGLGLPIVFFDQIYSFDVDALIEAIPRPEEMSAEDFQPIAQDLFSRLIQIADNAGATDEHRALNYLAVRYDRIYAAAAEAYGRNGTLSSVEVRPSRLGGARKIVDVVFSFRHRETGVVDQSYARVDVTEEFVFLVTPLSPYYPR